MGFNSEFKGLIYVQTRYVLQTGTSAARTYC